MAGEPLITITGNLGDDPVLRFTGSGHAVVNFSVAQTPRSRNQQSGEWVDDEPLWFRCNAWREMAENIAESFTKGMRVVVTGRLRASSFEDKQGNPRVGWELTVEEAGPSLRWATAQVQRSQPANNNGGFANQNYSNNNPWGGSQYNQQQQQQGGWGQPPAGNQPPPQNQPPQGPPPGQQNNVWAGGQPGGQPPPQQDAFGFDNNGPPPF